MTKIELDKFLPREIAVLQKIPHPNILDTTRLWRLMKSASLHTNWQRMEHNGVHELKGFPS